MFSKTKVVHFVVTKKIESLNNNDLTTNFYVEEIISDLKISFKLLGKIKKKDTKYVPQFSFHLV